MNDDLFPLIDLAKAEAQLHIAKRTMAIILDNSNSQPLSFIDEALFRIGLAAQAYRRALEDLRKRNHL